MKKIIIAVVVVIVGVLIAQPHSASALTISIGSGSYYGGYYGGYSDGYYSSYGGFYNGSRIAYDQFFSGSGVRINGNNFRVPAGAGNRGPTISGNGFLTSPTGPAGTPVPQTPSCPSGQVFRPTLNLCTR